MTRSKITPSIHKPPFDEESAIRFAKMEPRTTTAAPAKGKGGSTPRIRGEMPMGKEPQPDRQPITLLLKADSITTLQHEAARKGKAVDQIIDKLVAKHLVKNK